MFAPPHTHSPNQAHGAMGPLLRRCHAMGARCSRLDSLLPVLAWLSDESERVEAERAAAEREREGALGGPHHGGGLGGLGAGGAVPLEQYDSRWLAAAPENVAAAMGVALGGDLADAVLPEPPGLEAPDPIGPPPADGEVQSHEVALHPALRSPAAMLA